MPPENSAEKLSIAGSVLLAGLTTMGVITANAEPAEAYYVNHAGQAVVTKGDTLSGIIHNQTGHSGTQLYDHDVPAVAHANHLPNANQLKPGEQLDLGSIMPRPPEHHRERLAVWHVRSQTDTLWAWSEVVAELNHVDRQQALADIISANPGINPDNMQIGDGFRLPVEAGRFERIMNAVAHISHLRSQKLPPETVGRHPSTTPARRTRRPHPAPAQPRSSDPKVLAAEVLDNPNITVAASLHDRVRKSIADIVDDGQTFTHDVNHPGEVPVSPKLLEVLQILAQTDHITITSLTTGEHAPTSNHYKGQAVDIAVDNAVYQHLYANRAVYGLDELIFAHPPAGTTTLKHGVTSSYKDTVLREHADHIHFSVMPEAPATSKVEAPAQSPRNQLEQAPYGVNSNVLSKSGLSAQQLDKIFANTPFSGLGQTFIDMENQYGINALFASMHGALESAWGRSQIAQSKHNLFGINAYDSCPQKCATSYEGFAASIRLYAKFMSQNYLNPQGEHYGGGTTISDVFRHYSTAGQTEAQSISNMMNQAMQKLGK